MFWQKKEATKGKKTPQTTLKTNEQIVTSNLSVTYFPGQSNEVKSLDNINLSISEGEFIIFFGPSGCGKSTLLYSIAGLETGIQGDIFVEGKNLAEMRPHKKELYFRDTIGMVFQAYHLIPTLTVLQNVTLPLIAAGVKPGERQKRAMELLERFGVKTQANKLPNNLSGGQQQRVAICRAVINSPSIILADEPLGNLDSHSANEVVQLLRDLNVNFKKTVVLVTHDPTYLDIAHRVFFIKDGRLVDTKVNRVLGEDDGKMVLKECVEAGTCTKEFKFLSEQYSRLKPQTPSSLLMSYQAKNLATLALADFVVDDFDRLHEKIEIALSQNNDFSGVFEFLDVSPDEGGLGMDSRTAKKITNKIKSLAKELMIGENLPHRTSDDDDFATDLLVAEEEREEVVLRRAIFDELSIKLKAHKSLAIIDRAITDRFRGRIDRKELLRILSSSLLKGGAGLKRSLANKIAKRLELWLIGHKER
ncbi:MAG: ABC transporter ATP-binding protein [Patescibacteria group bacterium]